MKRNRLTVLCLLLILALLPVNAQAESSWDGEGEIGYLMTSGNSETESLNTKLNLGYESTHWRHIGHFEALYSAEEQETETGESEMKTSAEKYLVSAKTAYKFTETDYAFLHGSYEDDRFSGYDYQTSFSAGYGRRLFKTERLLMEIEVGPGYRYNRLDDGKTEAEAIARGYVLFSAVLTEGSSFKQEFSAEAGEDQTVTKSVSALKAQIVGALSMKASFTAEHTSTVPEDTDNTDTETALTLVYSF